MEITIESMAPQDRDEIVSIFNEGVQSGDLVLDTDDPGASDLTSGRNLVARAGGRIVGWAVVDRAGGSPASRTAAVSVFVKPGCRRQGIGRALLDASIDAAAHGGIMTLLSGIVPKNVPALLLHKKCGFRAIGMIEKAGIASGRWQNAVLLQKRCG